MVSNLAFRLGRPSWSRTASRTSADRESANGTAGLSMFANAGASADLGLGRLTAGFGGLVVLGLVGFYVWTREHQRALLLALALASAGGLT